MFKSIKKLIENQFSATSDVPPSEHDIQLASATLLFEVARADYQIQDEEISALSKLLVTHFKLSDDEVIELIELAKQRSEDAISLHGFTRTICDNWDNQQRCKLIQNCWLIALADGTIDTHERHLVRKIAALLYLNEKQIMQTREAARAQLKQQ